MHTSQKILLVLHLAKQGARTVYVFQNEEVSDPNTDLHGDHTFIKCTVFSLIYYEVQPSRADSTVNQNSLWHVTEHLEKSTICYIAAGLWGILSVELSYWELHSLNECCPSLKLLQEGPVTAQIRNETGKRRKEIHLWTSEFKNSSHSHNLIWHSAVCEICGRVCHVTLFLSGWYCTVWMYNNGYKIFSTYKRSDWRTARMLQVS